MRAIRAPSEWAQSRLGEHSQGRGLLTFGLVFRKSSGHVRKVIPCLSDDLQQHNEHQSTICCV